MVTDKQAARPRTPLFIVRFGQCELHTDTRQLLVAGQVQPVRRRVFDLMLYLIAQRPRTVPHGEILRAVWQRPGASASVLARAVMEARRACGDPADQPRHFLSVHGVGYRFAGVAEEGTIRDGADSAGGDGEAVQGMHALLQQAGTKLRAGEFDAAQDLAAAALAQATDLQSQSGRVRALIICSAVSLRRGTSAEAAKLAAQALQIARGEGEATLIALARSAVGFVHLLVGDRALAIRHFEESRDALAAPGHERDLLDCLSRLVMALRDVGRPEMALRICRQNQELARHVGSTPHLLTERNNEVMLLLMQGDEQIAAGRAEQALATHLDALARVDALLHDMPPGARQRQSALGNRAHLLEKLGRLDEAWEALGEFERAMDLPSLASTPVYSERHMLFRMQRAGLLAAMGRHHEALSEARASLAAAEQAAQSPALPRLYGTACDVARAAGLPELALEWSRRQLHAQQAVHASEAASLSSVLEAELNNGDIHAELQRLRAQLATLSVENAGLRQRMEALQGAVPVSPATGLAAERLMEAAFSARHMHAKARGLPMCMGLLTLANHADLAALQAPAVLEALYRQVSDVLGSHADVATPAVLAGAGRVVFHVRESGVARASEVCAAVLSAVERAYHPPPGLVQQPRWQCVVADAALHASPADCVAALVARSSDLPGPCPHMARR